MTQRSQAEYFDELVQRTQSYRRSQEFLESLRVIAALQDFSPFNAYLLRIQRPFLRFAAHKEQWEKYFGRTIRTDRPAYPLVIMWPFGPVAFVYDYEDTIGEPLPQHVLEPFRSQGYVSATEWERLLRNCRRRGVVTEFMGEHQDSAGWIQTWTGETSRQPSKVSKTDKEKRENPPVRFRVVLNGLHDRTLQYATFLHELGHLACGHMGGAPSDDWPLRPRLSDASCEFEAEAVSYIVCNRLGLRTNSEEYLAHYVSRNEFIPDEVSIYTVLTAAGLIESWTRKLTFPKKVRKVQEEQVI